jgi:hypothetical protein
MKRIHSTMTGADLDAWMLRHGFDDRQGQRSGPVYKRLEAAGEALGLSARSVADYLADRSPIPQTVALLCGEIDRRTRRKR